MYNVTSETLSGFLAGEITINETVSCSEVNGFEYDTSEFINTVPSEQDWWVRLPSLFYLQWFAKIGSGPSTFSTIAFKIGSNFQGLRQGGSSHGFVHDRDSGVDCWNGVLQLVCRLEGASPCIFRQHPHSHHFSTGKDWPGWLLHRISDCQGDDFFLNETVNFCLRLRTSTSLSLTYRFSVTQIIAFGAMLPLFQSPLNITTEMCDIKQRGFVIGVACVAWAVGNMLLPLIGWAIAR